MEVTELFISDPSIPGLVDLEVPNTDHGHCGKTEAIIKKVAEIMLEDPKLHWLLISDDDTILRCVKKISRPEVFGKYGFLEPQSLKILPRAEK
jgi:hypothetical protein